MRTAVIQSFCNTDRPAWISRCLDSVRHWCECHGYDWCFYGDELFARVPDWYMAKTGPGPVAADYARLVLAQEKLAAGYHTVIWLDADTLVLDDALQLTTDRSCAFGQEFWVQEEQGGLKVRRNVHNAVCLFHQDDVVLPFLAETVASIIRRANPDHIAPQMVGPKLLTALHSLHDFALLPQAGALSPAVVNDLVAGDGPALSLLLARTPVPLQAVNLCASLITPSAAAHVIDKAFLLLSAGHNYPPND